MAEQHPVREAHPSLSVGEVARRSGRAPLLPVGRIVGAAKTG